MSHQDLLQKISALVKRGRPVRYVLERPIKIIARPEGVRSYNFWFEANDISLTGISIFSDFKGLVPFQIGGVITATMDIHSVIFRRPIHIQLEVMRCIEREDGQGFGCKFLTVEEHHESIFSEGFVKIAQTSSKTI